MRPCPLVAALLALALPGCASGPPAGPAQSPPSPPPSSAPLAEFVHPGRVLPDIPPESRPISLSPDGSRQFLLLNMRLTEHPDGSLERAQGVLPSGQSKLLSVELPSRLGGGYLFAATSSSVTQIWRADSWLAPLQPLLRFPQAVTDLLPGFDRVYLRSTRSPTSFFAFDPSDGTWLQVGPLPSPQRFGPSLFADSWRAVIVSDLRGPLATFDGGASWLPLPIRGEVAKIEEHGARLLVQSSSGSLLLGPEGNLIEQGPTLPRSVDAGANAAEPQPPSDDAALPLGRRPLRLAVERGYPYRDGTAVVARAGRIAEVSIKDGEVVRIVENSYPDSYTSCQGIRLGRGVGFACGQAFGATTIYELDDGLSVRSVLHWPEPRAVFPSANGALVVRAPCPASTSPKDGALRYCVRDPRGRLRELKFEGDVGAERVVPLADGRVAVIVAPRPGAEGRLVVLDGSRAVTKALSLNAIPTRMASLVRRGLWLDGAQELRPGVIGLWVEAAGPIVGVQVDLDGRVRAGVVQPPSGAVVVSGRFGLVWKPSGESLETVDGGMTWTEFDMPSGWRSTADGERSCTAVGCVVGGFLRVGWGVAKDAADLEPAPVSSKSSNPPYTQPSRSRLRCMPTGRSSPPPLPVPAPAPSAKASTRVRVIPSRPASPLDSDALSRGWIPFVNVAPPSLGADDIGIASGRDYGDFRFRVYAWGPRTADWSRAGRFLLRVDNPYDAISGPWSSAPATSPWPDPSVTMVRIGNVTAAEFDPSGRAAVISWCPMPSQCELYGVSPGEPPLPLVSADPAGLPVIDSVVRTDEGWYLLAKRAGPSSVLWAADRSGATRRVATFPRIGSAYADDVTLVRQARGRDVALWTVSSDIHGNASWVVLPVDVATGRLGEPVIVGRTDFGGVVPPRCAAGQDGWMADLPLSSSLDLEATTGAHFGGSARVSLRAGSGWTCIDAISARGQPAEFGAKPGDPLVSADSALPLAVWDQQQNRRYELRCLPRP